MAEKLEPCKQCGIGHLVPEKGADFRFNLWPRKHPGREPLPGVVTLGTCSHCKKHTALLDVWDESDRRAAWEALPWYHGGPNDNPWSAN